MLSPRCLPGRSNLFLTLLVAAGLCMTGADSFAQEQAPQLSASVLSSESELDDEQQQHVSEFVQYFVGRILESEDRTEVMDARQRLMDPLRQRTMTRPPAHTALSDALAEALEPVVDRNSFGVRLNALILSSQLSSSVDRVVPLISDSLGHSSPGIRYTAAQTIARLASDPEDEEQAEDGGLSDEVQSDLLSALADAMAEEAEDTVLEQMYEAAGALEAPEARQVLLDVLVQRVNSYTGGLHEGLRADWRGIASLRRSIAQDRQQERDVDEALRQLTVIAAQLLDVVSRALQQPEVPEHLLPIAINTVRSVEETFDLALMHFAPEAESGRPLAGPAEEGEYDDLRLNALEWIGADEDSPGLLSESAIAVAYERIHGN